jgi:nucleotidyltransferase/DNA polymerase involved in DNA repair
VKWRYYVSNQQALVSRLPTNRPESLLSAKPPRPYHIARTVVLKLKTSDFKILTRSHTPGSPPASCEEVTRIALSLRERVGLNPQRRFRLVSVSLSNFREPEDAAAQPAPFT